MTNKTLYLTLDGAPHPPYTGRLLDMLDAHGVKATFFMEGHRIEDEPECGREVLRRGHAVGNHTYTHRILADLPYEEAVKDIEDCDRALLKHLGTRTRLVRPPYGTVTPELERYLADTGRELVLWSISVRDWEGPDAPSVARRLISQLDRDVVIVVLHDYLDYNAQVLDIAIPAAQQRGYAFATFAP